MEYRRLGDTDLMVSRLCFGALTIGPLQAHLSIRDGARVIREALESGVNFIDTADLYETYPYIREALKGYSNEVIIASKSYDYTREGMENSLDKALKQLNRDVIDLFLLHEQESRLTLKGHWPAYEYLMEMKEKGYVRAVGISSHTVEAVDAAGDMKEIDVIHPLYNMTGIGIQNGTRETMEKAIIKAHDQGKGIYGMKPLGGGNLLKHYSDCLSFVLEKPFLDAVAVGMKTPEEVEMNIQFFNGEPISKELKEKVARQPKHLHIDEWCEGCGECIKHCQSQALFIQAGKACVDEDKCLLCGYCGAYCPQFYIKIV